jgi:antitoxin MazE
MFMNISLRKVGNSRGVIIPAALLAACNMAEEVNITLKGKTLVISPVRVPRAGWFSGYQAVADSDVLALIPVAEGAEEWVW